MMQTGEMHKIEYLADICTSMLVKQRTRILKCVYTPPALNLNSNHARAITDCVHPEARAGRIQKA